jgi:hypothetical protein
MSDENTQQITLAILGALARRLTGQASGTIEVSIAELDAVEAVNIDHKEGVAPWVVNFTVAPPAAAPTETIQ